MLNIDYQKKYLKYKLKYNNLNKIIYGGSRPGKKKIKSFTSGTKNCSFSFERRNFRKFN